jgi:hypothetical protein
VPQLLAGLAAAAPFLLGIVTAQSSALPQASPDGTGLVDSPRGHQVFRFVDPAITEASALVVQDGLCLTVNDSGDTGRVFAVDRSGATVGVTRWSDSATDVEALSPAGPGFVWVGDLGDNLGSRDDIEITRVPVGRGDRTVRATSYRLTYSGGPTDAETLLRDPVTGRLYVATKNLFGGRLYAVPERLSAAGPNLMRPVGRVLPFATDGSFFPDGRHLIVRDYGSATVYDWPSLDRVGSFALPSQRQGEGIAVGPDDTLYLSSEGVRAPVVATRVPAKIRRAMAAQSRSPSASPAPAAGVSDPSEPSDEVSHDLWPWALGGLLGVGVLLVLLRALRSR